MKRILFILIVVPLLFGACRRPKTIPDNVLEAIVTEVFVSNAVVQGRYIPLNIDTLEIYQPIFDRYGYTPGDMLYTIDELSKRKSVRFTDILDNAIAAIERQSGRYDSLVMERDTIHARLTRRYREVVYTDTLHRFTRSADARNFEIRISIDPARYEIEYLYRIDSTDKNPYLQYSHHTLDSAGNRGNTNSRTLQRSQDFRRQQMSVTVEDPRFGELVVNPIRVLRDGEYRTNAAFDSLRITRYPLPEEASRRFHREILLLDSLVPKPLRHEKPFPEDYVTLRPDTTGIEAGRDTVVRPAGPPR